MFFLIGDRFLLTKTLMLLLVLFYIISLMNISFYEMGCLDYAIFVWYFL